MMGACVVKQCSRVTGHTQPVVGSSAVQSYFLSQRPIELKALSVQEALHVKEVTSIAEKEIQSSVANRALPK